jgi:hypothetical protein
MDPSFTKFVGKRNQLLVEARKHREAQNKDLTHEEPAEGHEENQADEQDASGPS